MGLDLGIEVRVQDDGFMGMGRNPAGTLSEIEERVNLAVREAVPGPVYVDVSINQPPYGHGVRGEYEFHMRPPNSVSVEQLDQAQHAILEWIWAEFGHSELELRTYWSP